MTRFNITTTVDITITNPDRDETDQVRIGQQQNFNSLIQGIGIRSNLTWDKPPTRIEQDGVAHWHWQFEVESVDVFRKGDDPAGLLLDDLQGIPVIKNLTNTVSLDKPVFFTKGEHQNIWISAI